jgi:hypothetical protein
MTWTSLVVQVRGRFGGRWRRDTTATLERLERNTERLVAALNRITDALRTEERRIMATLDDLVADVAAQTTLAGSIQSLVAGVSAKLTDLAAQLAAAIAAGNPAQIQAVHDAITAVNASLQASSDALAAAVPANTPVA